MGADAQVGGGEGGNSRAIQRAATEGGGAIHEGHRTRRRARSGGSRGDSGRERHRSAACAGIEARCQGGRRAVLGDHEIAVFWLSRFVLSPEKLATIPPVSVPAVSLNGTPVNVATPLIIRDGRAGKATVESEGHDLADQSGAVGRREGRIERRGAADYPCARDAVDDRRVLLAHEVMRDVAQIGVVLSDRTIQAEQTRRVEDCRIEGRDGVAELGFAHPLGRR